MAHTASPASDPKPEPKSLKPSLGLNELLEGDGEPRREAKVVKVEVADLKERAALRQQLAEAQEALAKERKMREDALGMYDTLSRARERFEAVPVNAPPEEKEEETREEPMAPTEQNDLVGASETDLPALNEGPEVDTFSAPQLARLPLALFQQEGQHASFGWLRGWVRETWRGYEKISRQRPAQTFTGWYAQPGAGMDRATPIDVKRELLERPFRDGTYYVRVRRQPDQDSPNDRFYIALVQPRPDAESANNTKLAANMIALRTTEDLSIRLKEALDRDKEQAREIGDLRADLNALRDDLAASERQCRALEDEIERLKAAGEPMMSAQAADELGVKAIQHFSKILEDPNAKVKAEFDRLRDFNRRLYDVIKMLFQGFFDRPALLRDILSDAPELFDAIVQQVNTLAEEAEQQERYLLSGQLIEQLKLLPAHLLPPDDVAGSDDAMLEALTDADRRIKELEAANAELKEALETECEANEALSENIEEEEEDDAGEEEEAPPQPRRRAAKRVRDHANGVVKGKARPKPAKTKARPKSTPKKNPPRKH